jgi:hypothetical protein
MVVGNIGRWEDDAAVVEGRGVAVGIVAACGGLGMEWMLGGMIIKCTVSEAVVRPSGVAVDEAAAWLIVMTMQVGSVAMDVAVVLRVAVMDVAVGVDWCAVGEAVVRHGGMAMDVAMGLGGEAMGVAIAMGLDGAAWDVAVGLDGAGEDVAVGLDLRMGIGLGGVRRQTIRITAGAVNCSGGASYS